MYSSLPSSQQSFPGKRKTVDDIPSRSARLQRLYGQLSDDEDGEGTSPHTLALPSATPEVESDLWRLGFNVYIDTPLEDLGELSIVGWWGVCIADISRLAYMPLI